MRTRTLALAALAVAAAPGLGCGGAYYAVTVNAAQARLEEARQLGAERRAPYEYYSAKIHLDEAAVEASEASYSDASSYAELAEQFAIEAIELSKGGLHAKKPTEVEKSEQDGTDEKPAGKKPRTPKDDGNDGDEL